MFTEQELHILIGCADARDLSQLQVDAVVETTARFAQLGIDVEVQIIRAAGSFVTPDVFMDVKRLIEHHLRTARYDLPTRYYVHIQSHGHLAENSSHEYVAHLYDLHLVEGSPLNCGMLGASTVGVEIEQLLLSERPRVVVHGQGRVIKTEEDIRWLLRQTYAYEGYLAGDWIRSIDLLRTHPRKQRRILEDALHADPDLTPLNVQITAGLLDYSVHALIRVDGGDPYVPFWDDVQALIREKAQSEEAKELILAHQSEKQKPLAGLLSLPDPQRSSRTAAAGWYLDHRGIENNGAYLPNTVFNMTGSSFDMPTTPFGPYVIAGFFYAVAHLGLTDQMVLGYDHSQTQRMLRKIHNDPILSLVVKKFGVTLLPLNHVDLVSSDQPV